MRRDAEKILVRREKRQVMAQAKLRDDRGWETKAAMRRIAR
jgi:hypothetical protein